MRLARSSSVPAVILVLCFAIGVHADTIAYVSAQNGTNPSSVFGTLDLNTGAVSQVATLNNIFVNDLAFAPNGTLYLLTAPFRGSGSAGFGSINPNTGVITDIAPNTVGLNSIGFNANGSLYGTTYTGSGPEALYSINPSTGATSFIADLSGPLSTVANQLRFIGNIAYTTSYTTPSSLYTINLVTGAGTLIGNTGLNQNNGLGAVVNGELLDIAATNPGARIFGIDPATGAATPGAAVNQNYVFSVPVQTPEPSSAAFVGAGLLALCFVLRRLAAAN